jgi:hypothetical protein
MSIALLRSIATNKEAISLALIVDKSIEGRIKDLFGKEKSMIKIISLMFLS